MPEYIFCTRKKQFEYIYLNNLNISPASPYFYKLIVVLFYFISLFIPKLRLNLYNLIDKTNKLIDARFNVLGSYQIPSKNIIINLNLLSKIYKKEGFLISGIIKTISHEDFHKAIDPIIKNSKGQEFIIGKIGY